MATTTGPTLATACCMANSFKSMLYQPDSFTTLFDAVLYLQLPVTPVFEMQTEVHGGEQYFLSYSLAVAVAGMLRPRQAISELD
jgi:hypothetical protein